jgi:hypothetical protein
VEFTKNVIVKNTPEDPKSANLSKYGKNWGRNVPTGDNIYYKTRGNSNQNAIV